MPLSAPCSFSCLINSTTSQVPDVPVDNLQRLHSYKGYSYHFDIPLPANSPHHSKDIGHSQALEDLMGETEKNRTKMSQVIAVNDDITGIQDLKELLCNSTLRCGVFVKVRVQKGQVLSVKIRCFRQLMSTLRNTDVGIWFKHNNQEYPHVRYHMLQLVGFIHLILYKAANNPRNKAAILTDRIHLYDRSGITKCLSSTASFCDKMLSCSTGGEIPGPTSIWTSKSIPIPEYDSFPLTPHETS